MVWGLPPGRAGRAPQASRHNRTAEAALDTGGGLAVGLASGPAVAVGRGLERVVGSVPDSAPVQFEHALTVAARPAVPTSRPQVE